LRALQAARLDAARALLRTPRCAHALLELGALLATAGERVAARTRAVRSRAITSFASAQLRRRHRGVRAGLEKLARAPDAPPQSLCHAVAELRHAVEFFRPLLRSAEARNYRNRLLRLERSLEWLEVGSRVDELVERARPPARSASAAELERAALCVRARAERAARQLARSGVLTGRPPPLAAR
jgi:hypothetical protein